LADAAVAERISAIWERSRRTHGAPRIHAMLARDGIRMGRKKVERLMRQLGIRALTCVEPSRDHLRARFSSARDRATPGVERAGGKI
jgi:transposase InsO family protein